MFKMEFLKLVRNNIIALIFGYVLVMSIGVNSLHLFFQDVEWVQIWTPKLTIVYIIILIDLLFWMAGMQISEDFETNMIQVMRTSRSVFQYFFSKHILLILFVLIASFLVLLPYIASPMFVLQFLFITFLLSFLMIGSGVLITMIVKKQSVLMIAGSVVTGFVFISLVRLLFPTWIIEPVAFNPFEYFIAAFYALYIPNGGFDTFSLLSLTILSFGFYLFSVLLFQQLTYKKGFRL